MHKVIPLAEKAAWKEEAEKCPELDIFYFPSYASLYPPFGDGDPFLFIYEGKGKKIYYAFFKRPLHFLPFSVGGEWFDIITPSYGYGGPFYTEGDREEIQRFRKAFETYCREENIVSEFVRFHPVYQNQRHLEEWMDVRYDRETVYIDLTRTETEIIANYHQNHRRNLRKGMKNGLRFVYYEKEEAAGKINEFYTMYRETMDKLNASKYSYFSLEYMEGIVKGMGENSVLGAVYYHGKMAAAALCLYANNVLHYHLGCSKKEFLPAGINVFLLHNLALWGKNKGFHTFHLGGGHVGRDSLFQFKHRFNQTGILDFYVGRKIHHPGKYAELINKWEEYYGEKASEQFFPAYRYQPKKLAGTGTGGS